VVENKEDDWLRVSRLLAKWVRDCCSKSKISKELLRHFKGLFKVGGIAGRNGADRVSAYFFFVKPETRSDPSGFGKFQPVPEEKGIKTVRIGAGRLGLVGSGGFCPPLVWGLLYHFLNIRRLNYKQLIVWEAFFIFFPYKN
jgi:hypothetical protein